MASLEAADTVPVRLIAGGTASRPVPLAEILAANQFADGETVDIRLAISRGQEYVGGGGAVPCFVIRPAEQIEAALRDWAAGGAQ